MKLWLVIYAANQIGGSAGPLPYGMDECMERRDALRQSVTDTLQRETSDEDGRPLTAEEIGKVAQMGFECEWHNSRPELSAKK